TIAAIAAVAALSVALGCESDRGARRGVRLVEPSADQQAQLEEARAARQTGDYDLALTMFREILADNPTVVPAYLGIGDIHMEREEYERAEPAYERAARLDPDNYDAQLGHGLALRMLERFAEALRAFHKAMSIEPESAEANLQMASTYLQLNQARSALAHARMAVLLDANSGPAHVNLGAVYEQMGRNADAIEEYLAASELMEPTPTLMLSLITVLAREKRYQEAVNTAENLVRLDPSANAYERLGWGYFRLGDFQQSIVAYRRAVELDPDHWPSWNGIGVNALNRWLLSGRNERDSFRESRTAFRRSLDLNPEQVKVITLMSNYGL
ncbi:MAG: tetratricopeptide repeat protein, partial [Planctomycetota bacterium]